MKIMTVVGTRPEIIRLSAVIKELDATSVIQHELVHTGQNYDYELNDIFFKDLGLRKPDVFLNAAGESAIETIGKILIESEKVLKNNRPDALLILGDTNSCLVSIAAKKMKIPIFHMEAGNRCFDQRVPEEVNRKIVDHIADINLTYSDISREYLLREGLNPDQVIRTGSPMFEVLRSNEKQIQSSNVLSRLGLVENEYFVVSAHREENVVDETNLTILLETFNALAEKYGQPIIVSTHPRTRNNLEKLGLKLHSNVNLLKPLGFFDYVNLQLNSRLVLSDSGTISEESSILGFKALNIRNAHERPEAMEQGVVIMTGISKKNILSSAEYLLEQDIDPREIVKDYSYGNVAKKVVTIILSYTDYVNRKVWRES